MTAFTPSGDLGIEYGLEDRASDASVWAYASPALTAAPSSGKARDPDTVGSDPFVAIALRPKLPRWTEVTPRDQVIVVDAGRAMFGERFARAKLLSVQLAQEMDRRDRMTVLACDVTCTAMPGGFVGPGAPAAHDVDAFLAGLRPEGATDLVGAVRAAATVPGRDRARDLRVVLLSDGVATAGYRATGRLAAAVSEALNDGRAEVVAVPIGADADVTLLAEVARGGGGVVVPYQPGQRLEVSALEVLNATYGTTLRDVEVTLPPGLHDVAPASLPPLRAGSESIVTARLSGDVVRGDIVLRGKVGGLPFEARYPVDARASSDPGNAFVSRLFAGARIADRERDASDAGRVELVALSRRFSVPSRFTSLLVLESEAMFKAFGIERAERGAQWTGEAVAEGATVAALGRGDAHSLKGSDGDVAGADDLAASDFEERKKDAPGGLGAIGHGAGGGGTGEGFGSGSTRSRPAAAPRPAPTQAPEPSAAPPAKSEAIAEDKAAGPRDLGLAAIGRRRGPGQFMRKVFVRRATISADSTNAVPADKLALARAAVQAAPDERSKHKDLAKLLALAGQLDELGEALDRWSIRDPLDADVIFGRADLAARRGDRDASLRVLGGALAASAMSQDEAFALASTVARSYERLGRSEACAFRVTAAELRPADNDALARAIACERGQGRPTAAERWLSMLKAPQRVAVELAVAKVEPSKAEAAQGDVVIVATWGGGADLDVALVDPAGRRAGAATRVKGARVEGATARDHETLALATGETGSFLVEMVRSVVAGPEGRDAPVSGRLTIRAFGQTQTLPFVLVGSRVSVARLDTRWEAELVPLDEGLPPNLPREFDRAAAGAALGRISLAHCAASGQGGSGHAAVTFGPVGRVTNVVIDDARFAGTPAARCITSALFGAAVPPFAGPPVRVGKSFTLP
jgi:hypothetical protein